MSLPLVHLLYNADFDLWVALHNGAEIRAAALREQVWRWLCAQS
jgi:hypothetical protein